VVLRAVDRLDLAASSPRTDDRPSRPLPSAASILTAIATGALAVLAYWQIRAGRDQTSAALAIARETNEATKRQSRPWVIANPLNGPSPGDGSTAAPDEMAVSYYLSNDGSGPAFNIEHGIEVAGTFHTWDQGMYPTMRAGQEFPPMHDPCGLFVNSLRPIWVGVKLTQWNEDIVYWTRFEDLLGDRFEVRNYRDRTRPAEFHRLTSSNGEHAPGPGGSPG
jgi:hypothetical protein